MVRLRRMAEGTSSGRLHVGIQCLYWYRSIRDGENKRVVTRRDQECQGGWDTKDCQYWLSGRK